MNLKTVLNFKILFKAGLWIRIRFGSGFNDFMDPDSESRSWTRIQGQENEEKNAFFSKFIFIFISKMYEIVF
jgi:hypothetical protein